MPDEIFEDHRLVEIYDAFDGEWTDLQYYLNLIKSLNVRSILDVGCGTGVFTRLLATNGFEVTGVDPTRCSLNFARRQLNADRVRWVLGDATAMPLSAADVAVMTGNVAQVFLTDKAWNDNLLAIHRALRKDGHLLFEARDPTKMAWLEWTPQKTSQRISLPNIGAVEG